MRIFNTKDITTFVLNLQNDSELFGRTLRVNIAKPLRIKENATRPVWADEEWLQTYSGTEKIANAEPTGGTEELENQKNAKLKRQGQEAVEIAGVRILSPLMHVSLSLYVSSIGYTDDHIHKTNN